MDFLQILFQLDVAQPSEDLVLDLEFALHGVFLKQPVQFLDDVFTLVFQSAPVVCGFAQFDRQIPVSFFLLLRTFRGWFVFFVVAICFCLSFVVEGEILVFCVKNVVEVFVVDRIQVFHTK